MINDKWEKLTLMDALYIVITDIIETGRIIFSRYPIENYQSVAAAKISLLTTQKTRKVTIRGRVYTFYPEYKTYPDPTKALIEVCMVNTGYCPAMGADFDGDMMFISGLYTEESNIEAYNLRRNKQMLLDPKGANSRTIAGEGLAALYAITRDAPLA